MQSYFEAGSASVFREFEMEELPIVCEWIGDGVQRIRSGNPDVCPLSPSAVEDQLSQADVVIVADNHLMESVRATFSEVASWIAARALAEGGRAGIALEIAPAREVPLWERIQEELREGNSHSLESSLWLIHLYPTREYLRVLPPLVRAGFDLLAVSDSEEATADGIIDWLKATSTRRQVFALFGAGHVRGDSTRLQAAVERRGARAVIIVTCDPRLDAALFLRFGPEVSRTWYRIWPDVLRAPPAVRVLSQAYTVTDNTSDIALNMLLHQPVRDWLNGMHLPLSRSFRLDLTRLRHTLLRDVAVRKFASLEDRVLWAFSAKGVEEEPEFRDFESGVRLLLPSELAEQILQNGR